MENLDFRSKEGWIHLLHWVAVQEGNTCIAIGRD